MHCFRKLEGCKKYNEVRFTLKEAGDNEGLMPSTVASAGHPASHKKDKAEKLAGSSTTRRIDASITLMVELMSTNSKKTHRRSNASSKEMMETQQ
jgi:hypothetical protein